MKFSEFKYERPDLELLKKEMDDLLETMSNDISLDQEIQIVQEVFDLQDEVDTMQQLVGIRHSLDTRDKFYEEEQNFFDENSPIIQELNQKFIEKLLSSNNRKGLEEEYGSLLFEQAELAKKTFTAEIIPDLQLENKLSSEYSKLSASAKIEFDGETYNLSQMRPFTTHLDRDTRHRAQLAVSGWFEQNEEQIDRIYDDMVKVRTKIAKILGYKNFVQLGYDRMGRLDYDHKDVKGYRDQILKYVVPVVQKLTERKAKRIQIEDPKSYDLSLSFLTGNPTPKGNRDHLVEQAKEMYEDMSKETGEFWNFMMEHELLELEAKEGKMGGGYCTFIPGHNSPFIFSNFNGTAGDVDVLTHEAGHAFQVYSSREQIPAYRWPTYEAAEIHSMSMEFFAWPWIDKFFKEDTEKYKFSHLAGALTFLPYGVAVDEFQHGVYENPELTPDERKTLWRSIEKKYLPFKDYDDDKFMDKGTFWFRQGHIFGVPFYYIDYTLAQVCALQYWVDSRKDHGKALEGYKALCKLGGSKTFVNLVESAGLDNPFKDGVVENIITPINKYLDSVDDTKL